ncbi:hypothetical protein H8B02_05065 [Bradyrhizobium sp. Pear77]|uniref:hypothetical protein n=1 Tax=Bradyrhizobium altum TaxID=1571202 RepID=UPI001E2BC3D7|nr:hypothetical protein [Bradyrhizobium altum]MCC8952856.1 hypothetical protein [Bradyrhizobium altum]
MNVGVQGEVHGEVENKLIVEAGSSLLQVVKQAQLSDQDRRQFERQRPRVAGAFVAGRGRRRRRPGNRWGRILRRNPSPVPVVEAACTAVAAILKNPKLGDEIAIALIGTRHAVLIPIADGVGKIAAEVQVLNGEHEHGRTN